MAKRLSTLNEEVRRSARHRLEEHRHPHFSRWVVLAAIYFLTLMLTSPFLFYLPSAPAEGQVVEEVVRSRTDFDFVTAASREAFERERARLHERVYRYRPGIKGEVMLAAERIFDVAQRLDTAADNQQDKVASLRRVNAGLAFLTPENVGPFVATLRDPRFQLGIRAIVNSAYDEHVVVDGAINYRAYLKDRVVAIEPRSESIARRDAINNPLPYPPDWYEWNPLLAGLESSFGSEPVTEEVRRHAELLLSVVIAPSLEFDGEATAERRTNFRGRDLATVFAEGEVLVRQEDVGKPASAETAALLTAHRDAVRAQHRVRFGGHALYTLIVFLIISFYVRKFSREFQFNTFNVTLIALPVLIGLSLQTMMILLADGAPEKVGYLFPAGAIGMLGVLLLDVRMALLLVTWGCLLFGLQVDLNYEFVIVGLFGGYTGVAALYTIRKRWEVFIAAFLIGLVNAGIIIITSFIVSPDKLEFVGAGLGFFAGIFSFLVLAILPLFERFGIVTDMQLLELTGLHQPLLRQVEELAPGTWQHTLNVAKLAEAAASEIGVNYLLVRAGCYYHDIGKVKKPEYFTENQITNEAKMLHPQLRPMMSTLIIKNHVKEGVEMALKEGLPERIIDFIQQHHGTTVITYFYNKALEAQSRGEIKEPVRIEDYRYPGPKPQTIEAAIVMLADSTEATATARLSGRTVREEDVQQLVRTTILDKFNDGQFDECNLTLRDLNVIREVFVKVLKSRFHTRIDYPKQRGASGTKQDKPRRDKPRDSRADDESTDGSGLRLSGDQPPREPINS